MQKKTLNRFSTKKLALCGIFTALSLIVFCIENLLPPLFIPGAKLGLSNVFILLSLIVCGTPYAFVHLAIKCLLGSIFSGNISAIIYSLPAGFIALVFETVILFYVKRTSIVATSVVGSTLNITVQNLTFCLVTYSVEYLIYLPYLALIGVCSGVFVGFTAWLIVKKLPNKLFIEDSSYTKVDIENNGSKKENLH